MNGHTDNEIGRNGVSGDWNESGNDATGEVPISAEWVLNIEDFGKELCLSISLAMSAQVNGALARDLGPCQSANRLRADILDGPVKTLCET